jgi:acyl carrier protein
MGGKMHPNDEQIRAEILAILKTLAPEIDPATIIPDKPVRAQIDLDSMDWLNVLAALHEKLGVEIPETDYGKVTTLDGIVAYLTARIPAVSSAPAP